MESEESEAKDPGAKGPLFKGVRFYVSGEIDDDVSTSLKISSVFCICKLKISRLGN